jgi:hypothetical protein
MMDAVVGLASAFAEDADAVDDDVAAVDDGGPGIGIEEALEMDLATAKIAQTMAAQAAARAAAADDHPQPPIAEGGDDMAADETGTTEDQHHRCGTACVRLWIGGDLDCESAHALLLFDGSVGYFCLDRNI